MDRFRQLKVDVFGKNSVKSTMHILYCNFRIFVKSTHNLIKEYEIGNFHFEHPVTQTKTTFFDLSYPINIFEQIEHFKHAFLNLVLILSYLKS